MAFRCWVPFHYMSYVKALDVGTGLRGGYGRIAHPGETVESSSRRSKLRGGSGSPAGTLRLVETPHHPKGKAGWAGHNRFCGGPKGQHHEGR